MAYPKVRCYWLIFIAMAVGCNQRSANPTGADFQPGVENSTREFDAEEFLARLQSDDQPSQPEEPIGLRDAHEVIATALAEANNSEKRLLVHYGASWCKWCHLLEDCLDANRDLLESDYVLVKIDECTMKNTNEVGAPMGKPAACGIPWMAILDSQGKPLVTCEDGPSGTNIGHPIEPEEIEHFMSMIRQTAQRLTPSQLSELESRWEKQTSQQKLKQRS